MNIRSVLTTNLDMSTTRVCTERTPQCTMSFQMMLKLGQDIGRAVYIKREICPHYENSTTIKQLQFNTTPLFANPT
jgi:hypothetical protein